MVSVREGQRIVLEAVNKLEAQSIKTGDALRRVLAEEITSPTDIPPFDNSAMDGFALRAEDVASATADAPVRLKIKATLRAGEEVTLDVGAGECVRIMTGATIPKGADSILIVEESEVENDELIVKTPVEKGDHVRCAGEDIKQSQAVLMPGILLRPQELGVLASLGIGKVRVTRRPVVASATTGDELVGIDDPLTPGKIRDSNRYSLRGLVMDAGCTPLELGVVPDDRKLMEKTFRDALKKNDMLLTTGGVSMGEYDLVKDMLSSLGKIEFWKVNMKPGKPLAFGIVDGKPFFGLPGNPVSCMVSFVLFVRPALMKMMGNASVYKEELRAEAIPSMDKKKGRTEFKRGVYRPEEGVLKVDLTGPQGSGILTSMVRANCLIHLPEDQGPVSPGDPVNIIPLD